MEALEILATYRDIKLKEQKERELWKKCFEYVNSRVDGEFGQWKKEWRTELGERPAITFNIIKKYVNRICGAQVGAKLDERAYPRDDQSDAFVGDVLTDLIKYVKDVNDAELAISKMFRHGIICGRGFIKTEWSDLLDPEGEITITCVDPRRIYIIGDGEEYDLSKDRKGIIEEIQMDKEEVILRWGKENEIDGLANAIEDKDEVPTADGYDYGFGQAIASENIYDKDEKKLKVLRCQKIKREKVKFLKPPDGEMIPSPKKKEDVQALVDIALSQGIELTPHEVIMKYVDVTYSVGNVMLEEKRSEYKHGQYDITAFFAYNDGGVITGVVQDLLDPQDEKNKRRSQAIHLMGTAAKNSHFVKKGAFDDINEARKQMSKVGGMIEVNGDPRQVTSPIESNTTAVPALLQLEMQSGQDMKEISGLSDASLGIVPEGVKSGRGITALQQPAETMVAELFNHLYTTRKIVFGKVLALIQQYYKEEKRVRVLGDYSAKLLPPQVVAMRQQLMIQMLAQGMSEEEAIMRADKMIEVIDGSKVLTINKQVGMRKLNDITVGRYDVVIDQVSHNPTMRRGQYQDMLNLKAMGVPIADELLIKFSDIRGKEEIIQSIEATRALMMQMQLMGQKPKTATPAQEDQSVNTAGGQF